MEGQNMPSEPMFGMTAVRDTRAMDLARYKNKTQQMLLEKQQTILEHEYKHKALKLEIEIETTREFYRDLDPKSARPVVCPRGLSYEQKQNYRQIHQRGQLSISLDEFDKRMSEYRRKMLSSRYGDIVPITNLQSGPCDDNRLNLKQLKQNTNDNEEKYIPLLPRNRTFIPHEILYGSQQPLRRQKTNINDGAKRPLLLTIKMHENR